MNSGPGEQQHPSSQQDKPPALSPHRPPGKKVGSMRTMRNIFPVALAATLVAAFATAAVPANAQDRNFGRDQARFGQQNRPEARGNFGGRDAIRPVGPERPVQFDGRNNDRGYNGARHDFRHDDRYRENYRAYAVPEYRTEVDVNYVPPCPGPNYVWVAGYWNDGYWVDGQWVYQAPVVRYAPAVRFGYDREWDREWDHNRGFDRDHHEFRGDRDHRDHFDRR